MPQEPVSSQRTTSADTDHPGCPVWSGNFSGGGEREPLESYRIYDEINRLGGHVWVDEGVGYHVVTKRDVASSIALNPTVFSSNIAYDIRQGGIGQPYPLKPLHLDPPEHIGWRRLLAPPFAPSEIRPWEEKIRERANALIDRVIDQGHCDFVKDFAHVFPTTVFLDFMGLPLTDLPQFMNWEMAILHPGPDGTYLGLTGEQAQAAVFEYFSKLIAQRRQEPDVEYTDLLAKAMSWELHGEPFSEENLLFFCLMMFEAGLDTVTAELAYGMMHLATHDKDRTRIVSDPAVIDDAVEELLRVYPIALGPRVVLEDTDVEGCPVKRGDYVVIGLAGVGRNEASHERATEVDFDRVRLPNTTFGVGIHRCVGAHLARLELKVAYEEWHRRIPNYRIPDGATFTECGSLVLGLKSLPLEWDPPTSR